MWAEAASAAETVFDGSGTREVVLVLTSETERLALTPSDIAAAVVAAEDSIAVVLQADAATAFGDLTNRYLGTALTVIVCGQEVMTATVRARVTESLLITVPEDKAHAFAVALGGAGRCP